MDAEVECKSDRVKIIAMSDLHEQIPNVDVGRYDVCVIAGDFSSGVIRDNDVRGSFSWLSGNGRDWLNRHGNVQFVIVPGNHDLAMYEKRKAEDFGWPDNAHLLIDEVWGHPESGLKFYGTPWTTAVNGGAFSRGHDELVARFENIPADADVVVTHSPPDIPGTGLTGTSVCSAELTAAIEKAHPLLLLCGHEHKLDHRPVKMACGTIAVNLSLQHHKQDPHTWRPREIVLTRRDRAQWLVDTDWVSDMRIRPPSFENA